MSTELPFPVARAGKRQHLKYRRLTLVVIACLALVAGVLGAVNAAQGPRLSSGEANPQALISRDGQRVLLHANQPLADIAPEQVTVTPSAAAEVSVDRSTVTVRFAGMLDFGTDYSVTVEDARGSFTGIGGQLQFQFSTPDIDVYSLLRDTGENDEGQDAPDRVFRHSLSGDTSNEVVFEAPRIQEYATLDNVLAAVTLDESNTPSIVLVSLTDGMEAPVFMPAARTVARLHASDSGDSLGFVLDAGQDPGDGPHSALFLYDLADGSGVPTEVTGLGGEPLAMMDWTFVPGTTSIVVQAQDQQLYLVDPLAAGDPTPLGQHAEMRGFVPGTVQLVVADPLSGSLIDLATGITTLLELPDPDVSAELFPGKLVLLSEDSYVQVFTGFEAAGSTLESHSTLVVTGPDGSRELYRTASSGSRVGDYCLSPNGEYLAVEVIGAEGTPDAYPGINGYSATSIYFVRLDDGSADRGVNGFLPDWCRT